MTSRTRSGVPGRQIRMSLLTPGARNEPGEPKEFVGPRLANPSEKRNRHLQGPVAVSLQRCDRRCHELPASTAEAGPPQHRGRDRQVERLRGLALPLAFRLSADLEVGEGGAAVFRTSSTTSCHQCSAGALSSPSSRWRVSANDGSWCHPSQSARVLHVPTITRLSSWSVGRRSCPPTQPRRSLAADRRLRMTASQSRPAPGFRYTWVTIVFIAKPPGLLVGHCQSN